MFCRIAVILLGFSAIVDVLRDLLVCFKIASSKRKTTNYATIHSWTGLCVWRYLALVVSGGDVHLLLHHVVDVGGGAALDPFLLLPLQLVSHHLDGLCPLIPG